MPLFSLKFACKAIDSIFRNYDVGKALPRETDVTHIWNQLVLLKKKDVLAETKDLSIAEKKLLVAIAHGIDHDQLTYF